MNSPVIMPGTAQRLTVAGAFFLEVLDATIMIVAIVPMSLEMNSGISAITLSLAVYLLALAVFTPLSGQFGDRLGLAATFEWGFVIFCIASVACALSQTVWQLGLARLAQGFGSALIVPAGRALILAHTHKINLPSTMAWLIAPALSAPLVAPYLAALILNAGSWRWIFVVLALCAGVLIIASRLYLRPLPAPSTRPPALDACTYGFWALCAVALYGVFMYSALHQPYPAVAAGVAALIGAIALGQRLSRRRTSTRDHTSAFNNPTLRLNLLSGSAFRISIYAFPTLLVLHLTQRGDYSVMSIGHCLFFIFAGNLIAKPVAARMLTANTHLKRYMVGAALANSFTLSSFLLATPQSSLPTLWCLCAMHGCARSFQFLGYSATGMRDVEPAGMYSANIVTGSVMQLNALIGQALPALLAAFLIPASSLFLTVGIATTSALSFLTVLTAARLREPTVMSARQHPDI